MRWFYELNWKGKSLIHLLMLILIIIILPLILIKKETTVGFLIWFLFSFMELIFIVFSVKSFYKNICKKIQEKKLNAKKNNNTNNISETYETEKIVNKETKKEKNILEKDFELPRIIFNNEGEFKRKYCYTEKLCFCENIDSIKILSRISFKQESDNQYDNETIAAYFEDKKIGLLYKGNCRDILNKCFKTDNDNVIAFVKKIDLIQNAISLLIGFYEIINSTDIIETTLTKTNKIDSFTDEKRQEQVELLTEKDIVSLEEDYESDCLIVKSDTGYELGELSAAVSKKVMEKVDDIYDVPAYVSELDYDINTEKTKVKIKIVL